MTQKKDAVGNNPLSHLIPRGPAPRPQLTTPPVPAPDAPITIPAAAPVTAPLPIAANTVVPAPAAPAVSPVHRTAPAVAAHGAGAAQAVATPTPDATGVQPLKRCTVRLPVALLERMTSAIVHTPGMTQADFVHDAIAAHLDDLERKRGSAFPVYGKKLRPGRKSW